VVLGNKIGVGADGASPLGNTRDGVRIADGATTNTVGGTAPGAGNIIAYNAQGVFLSSDNVVRISILQNSIFSNNGLGINLGDPPGNHDQQPPALTSITVSGADATIRGTLNSNPGEYRIEFFAGPDDADVLDQGKLFLGFVNVVVPNSGFVSFTATGLDAPPGESAITATATNLTAGASQGDTSPFSQPLEGPTRGRSWFN
jgi:hypothetical protein